MDRVAPVISTTYRFSSSLIRTSLTASLRVEISAIETHGLMRVRGCVRPGLSPKIRPQALEVLLHREEWTRALLDRLEAKQVTPEDFGAGARQQLVSHPSDAVRERAQRLFAQPISPERQQLVAQYLPEITKTAGNSSRGAAHFAQQCAVCHRLNQQGGGAGPDLATLVDRSPERMLIAILDPNRAVEDRYLNYVAQTRDGEEYSGLLAAESANSLTLVSASGARATLLRSDVVSLTSTRRSIMPEGFEQFLKPPDMADLLAFLNAAAVPPRRFPGNRPEPVKPDASGALRLTSIKAEIFGDGIAFEAQYKNLGSWNNEDARAGWTLEVPAGGAYDVWLHWACHDNEAGDTFRFQVGEEVLTAKVPSTRTWDIYEARRFGRLDLKEGQQRAVFQAAPPLRSYLIDLREVRLVPVSSTAQPQFERGGTGPQRAALQP
jgi:putative heme-binding domain-containing protein